MQTKREKIIALHIEEPTLDTVEVAKRLGLTATRVGSISNKFKIGIPLVSPEKRLQIRRETVAKAHVVQRQNRAMKAKSNEPKTPREGSKSYKVVEYVRNNPSSTRSQVMEALDIDSRNLSFIVYRYKLNISESYPIIQKKISTFKKPRVIKPAKNNVLSIPVKFHQQIDESKIEYYLRENDSGGRYLHFSCQGFTDSKEYAWVGNNTLVKACKSKFDIAKDLISHKAPAKMSSYGAFKRYA